MERRQFLAGAAGLVGGALIPRFAFAKVPTPFTFDMSPPMDSREKFIEWGVAQRGEDPKFLGERFDRFGAMVRNEDIWDERHKRAFLLTHARNSSCRRTSAAPMSTPSSTSASA